MTTSRDDSQRCCAGRQRKQHGGAIVGILLGSLFGLLVAFCIAWYMLRSSFDTGDAVPGDQRRIERQVQRETGGSPAGGGYNFYEMLEKGKVPAPLPPQAGNAEFAAVIYLQAGDFEKPVEADTMRALLALNGIDASVQRLRGDDGRTVHRVRIGPFDTEEEMAVVQARLIETGISFMSSSSSR